MIILHSADLQVKNRTTNLYQVSNNTLKQIEKAIRDTKAEAAILAGDFWEYAEPNESERKLIYSFISRLVNIKTLKELLLIAGNHDLLKEKKQSETTIGYNPINIFMDMLENLDPEKVKKITYINESKIYPSKVSDKIQYVGYSLEDDMNLSPETVFDCDKLNICVFHAMLKEYVDMKKLPLRKDVYNSLKSIEIFPENSLISGGDIHENIMIEGSNGQKFYYPGSPMQHNHNEGDFVIIGDKVEIKSGESKSIKSYFIPEDNDMGLTVNDILVEEIPLIDTICYTTLEFDSNSNIIDIKKHLNEFNFRLGEMTIVKIKSSNIFLQYEAQLYDIVESRISELGETRAKISFDYDKLTQSNKASDNVVIQKIIEEKNAQLKDENSEESDVNLLSASKIDDLILDDIQLGMLFDSILTTQLKSSKDEEFTVDEIKNDVMSLFQKQLSDLQSSTKRYNLILEDIETNGFMALMANRINLLVPGIVRILGTNGIGKTTLYNMIRWVISGDVFPGMSKASVMKNNLLVFNKNNINQDLIFVKLGANINNTKVYATRTVERKWKNNTTDEEKGSINWKDYISTVDRTFKLEITQSDGSIKTITGESAEKSIMVWFGATLDNILFMNQSKIETMLRTPSDKLNEMILNFIGVDYLKKLEDNLDSVKTDLMNVSKPKLTKEDIHNQLLDNKIHTKNDEESLSDIDLFISEKVILIDNLKTSIEELYPQLVSIGNIPQIINEKKSKIDIIDTFFETFETKTKKDKQLFDLKQPVKDNLFIDNCKQIITESDEKVKLLKQSNIDITKDIDSLINTGISSIVITETSSIEKNIESTKSDITTLTLEVESQYEILKTKFDDVLKLLKDKKIEKTELVSKYNFDLQANLVTINNNLISIESGVCKECDRAFSDDFETHKIELLNKNEQLGKDNLLLLGSIQETNQVIDKADKLIATYSGYRDMVIAKNINICDVEALKKDNSDIFEKIIKVSDEIEKLKKDLIYYNNLLNVWKKAELIQHGDYSIQETITHHITLNQYIDLHVKYCEHIKSNNLGILKLLKEIESNNELVSKVEKNYTEELEKYQQLFNENVLTNNEIEIFNQSVDEHNNSKLLKSNEKSLLMIEVMNLENVELLKYTKLNDSIGVLKLKLSNDEKDFLDAQTSKNTVQLNLQRLKNNKEQLDTIYSDYLKYQKNNLIWKLYSKLIKDNFKDIVFEYYRTFLNSTLNVLLENVNFKLFWNQDSELYHISHSNGKCIYQPVQQSSGMETCFLGLALVYTIHLLNVKNTISHIFIDEISGTLNSGKGLSYDAENYKELLVLILSKFKDKTLFVIDHSIDNLFETQTYEVVPSPIGSKYVLVA